MQAPELLANARDRYLHFRLNLYKTNADETLRVWEVAFGYQAERRSAEFKSGGQKPLLSPEDQTQRLECRNR
jgi:hypothetical protein